MDKKTTKIIKKEPENGQKNKKTICKKMESNPIQEDMTGYYSEKQRESKIRRTRKQLAEEYEELNPKDNPSVDATISRMAFLMVHIEEQEKIINRDGTVEEYKNGENQFGVKDSTTTKIHDRMFNDFMKAKKQLDDMKTNDSGKNSPGSTISDFTRETNRMSEENHGRQQKLCRRI